MSFSIYQASAPVYVKLLAGRVGMIEKAVADAETRKFSPKILFTARLIPEMWSFSEQVKATTNHAYRGTARLAGLSIPEIPDAVGTAAEMKARIAPLSPSYKALIKFRWMPAMTAKSLSPWAVKQPG
jgi:hypothetical protein